MVLCARSSTGFRTPLREWSFDGEGHDLQGNEHRGVVPAGEVRQTKTCGRTDGCYDVALAESIDGQASGPGEPVDLAELAFIERDSNECFERLSSLGSDSMAGRLEEWTLASFRT